MVGLAVILVLQSGRVPRVSIAEAVSAAEWFCRCVDIRPAPVVHSVQFSTTDRFTFGGVPRYYIQMSFSGSRRPVDLQVDAISGQVISASSLSPDGGKPSKARTDQWVRRLGWADELKYNPQLNAYALTVRGVPICNLNGDSIVWFTHGFTGSSAAPAAPTTPPRMTRDQALAWVTAEQRRMMPNWPQRLESRADRVVFYDDASNRTKWGWKVSYGSTRKGTYQEMSAQVLDAGSGSVIPEERLTTSRWIYRSRAARSGLAHVPMDASIQATIAVLAGKMRQVGRTEKEPRELVLRSNVQAFFDDSTSVTMKPNGDLTSFVCRDRTGRMEDSAAALAFGRKFILDQHPPDVEGQFRLENRPVLRHSNVQLDQTAFGFPYFAMPLASVSFDSHGSVSMFHAFPASPRPKAAPGPVLARDQIEAKATELARAAEGDLLIGQPLISGPAWMSQPGSGEVRLVYSVSYRLSPPSSPRRALGVWSGVLDAQTGSNLPQPDLPSRQQTRNFYVHHQPKNR